MLCDLDWGGGPGGGGGNGMPGSHLAVDDARERDDDGVVMAPVEAARREAGGLDSSSCDSSSSEEGVSIARGAGRRIVRATCSLFISGEILGASGAGLLEKDDMLNRDGTLSLEPARVRIFGGGGKTGFEEGSGDDLYTLAGDNRVTGEAPDRPSSAAINDDR